MISEEWSRTACHLGESQRKTQDYGLWSPENIYCLLLSQERRLYSKMQILVQSTFLHSVTIGLHWFAYPWCFTGKMLPSQMKYGGAAVCSHCFVSRAHGPIEAVVLSRCKMKAGKQLSTLVCAFGSSNSDFMLDYKVSCKCSFVLCSLLSFYVFFPDEISTSWSIASSCLWVSYSYLILSLTHTHITFF